MAQETIFLVDDDDLFHQSLKDILELSGYTVLSGNNGVGAVEICQSNQVDLVITDLMMPEKDGLELISEIHTALPQTKIIAITGGGTMPAYRDLLAEALRFGAVSGFQKPFDIQLFAQEVTRVLRIS